MQTPSALLTNSGKFTSLLDQLLSLTVPGDKLLRLDDANTSNSHVSLAVYSAHHGGDANVAYAVLEGL